jgi:hypothetical protein
MIDENHGHEMYFHILISFKVKFIAVCKYSSILFLGCYNNIGSTGYDNILSIHRYSYFHFAMNWVAGQVKC